MSEGSAISWTHDTFNPWWGCVEVSEACRDCYAKRDAARFRPDVTLWGTGSVRQIGSEAVWAAPRRWNRQAIKAGVRRRVFCASMADVFELHEGQASDPDGQNGHRVPIASLDAARARLWELIEATSGGLDWLLLTKRPQNVRAMVPPAWLEPGLWVPGARAEWPGHAWVGTTTETQERADERVPKLLEVPAAVRFVSAEPLLGPLDLRAYLGPDRLGWVIAGGESGHRARPMTPAWVFDLLGQTKAAGAAFHFKQWGEFAPNPEGVMVKVGKKAAGRMLGVRTWDEIPGGVA